MKKLILAVAACGLLGGGYAMAQSYPQLFLTSPQGREIINLASTSPQFLSVYTSQLRDSQGYLKSVAVTGFSIAVANGQSQITLNPAGTLATGTITTAAAPVDGQEMFIFSSQIVTALTLTASTGQTINNGITALAANTRYGYQYSASNLTWDRIN